MDFATTRFRPIRESPRTTRDPDGSTDQRGASGVAAEAASESSIRRESVSTVSM
jgi:hypothetical protein